MHSSLNDCPVLLYCNRPRYTLDLYTCIDNPFLKILEPFKKGLQTTIFAKFSERVENSVGKGEIANSPFTQFSKNLFCRHIKPTACLVKG